MFTERCYEQIDRRKEGYKNREGKRGIKTEMRGKEKEEKEEKERETSVD